MTDPERSSLGGSQGAVAVSLRDGTRMLLRPIRPEDKDGLLDGFNRLSDASRYRRFFTATPRLTAGTLAYLTEIDYVNHYALVARIPTAEHGFAVARYIRSADRSDAAEVAVAVADDMHGRGVGTVLMDALTAVADVAGIRVFLAQVGSDNPASQRMMTAAGGSVVAVASGVRDYEIDLTRRQAELRADGRFAPLAQPLEQRPPLSRPPQ